MIKTTELGKHLSYETNVMFYPILTLIDSWANFFKSWINVALVAAADIIASSVLHTDVVQTLIDIWKMVCFITSSHIIMSKTNKLKVHIQKLR